MPASALASAMDQMPMPRAAAARAAIQRRECSEIFLALCTFAFALKSYVHQEPYRVKICKLSSSRHSGSLDWDDWVHRATRAGLAVSLQLLVNDLVFGS
jgi:hypothetical protein